jgi:hypothetical protein
MFSNRCWSRAIFFSALSSSQFRRAFHVPIVVHVSRRWDTHYTVKGSHEGWFYDVKPHNVPRELRTECVRRAAHMWKCGPQPHHQFALFRDQHVELRVRGVGIERFSW